MLSIGVNAKSIDEDFPTLARIVSNEVSTGSVFTIDHEINESKRPERDLLIITTVLNRLQDAVLLKDEQFYFIYANDAACRSLGYTREEFATMTPVDIDPDLDFDTLKEIVSRLTEVGEHSSFERRHRTYDGRIFHVEISLSMIEIDGKKYILSICREISERKQLKSALHKSRDFLNGIISSIPIPVFVKDRQHRWILLNEAFCKFVGHSKEELLGKSDFDFFPEHEARVFLESDDAVFTGGEDITNEDVITDAKGEIHNIVTHKTLLDIGDEEQVLVGTISDVTERKRVEMVLQDNEKRLSNIINFFPDAILAIDNDKRIVIWNHAIEKMTGISAHEMIGKGDYAYTLPFYGVARPQLMDLFWTPEHEIAAKYPDLKWEGDNIVAEVFCPALDGGRGLFVWNKASPLRDSEGRLTGAIECIRDITEHKKHEAELLHVANHDMVTGLPNRRLLTDRLDQAVAHTRRNGKTLAVCYLDLDNFKPINDQHGHAVGDRVLVTITQHLKGILRADDTLACLGGDEFVLLLTNLAHTKEVLVILDRVLAAVSSHMQVENTSVSLSASIGVTLYPEDDVDADTLLRHADQAMCRAKENGKNRYHLFDPDHERQVQAHRNNIQRLQEALDNDEFVLHYQPKVDLVSGSIVGAEALIRWRHPEYGLLSPASFLHYLDGSDLEISVGEWVIDSVLKQIDLWSANGLSFPVSANIGAEHLLSVDFAERLRTALEQHPNVAPADLELEIVETAALSDISQAVNTLTRCRALGVKISLDDFGTGYSSLTYLRQLPVDILKIDQSFVRDMLTDPSDRGIVVSVVQLAQTFNRAVIAEGVETLEQGMMLIELGCRIMQGYCIARPMPAEQMPDWVDQWRSTAIWKNLKT